ncbi:MAG TPA: hypothetical protein VKI65_10620 [Gemmataceae bacterium]|nr:hypothetical protein [Gemmataceae bacterium]
MQRGTTSEGGDMIALVIQHESASLSHTCGVCGDIVGDRDGPQLALADSPEPVCRDCGRDHAPSLVALLDLAQEGRRIGRIGRHSVFPPLTALLDLSRAAENYSHSLPRRCRQAA